jgi:signal transduction histidine kinase
MRERAELLQGRFDIQSAPGKGTLVRVTIPLEQER